jgi:pentatricopeptide repeat protein
MATRMGQHIADPPSSHYVQLHPAPSLSDATCEFLHCLDNFRMGVSLEEVPNFTPTYRSLAACYAHIGRLEEARSIIKRMAALTPVLAPSTNPLRNPEHRELFRSGLRLAAAETP